MATKKRTTPKLELRLQLNPPSFTESALPQTMEMAKARRRLIMPLLLHIPNSWPFEDRVYVWLCPRQRSAVKKFHDESGPSLDDKLVDRQLRHVDEDLFQMLMKRLGL